MERPVSGIKADTVPVDQLVAFSEAVLTAAGADAPTAHDATQAMLHASLHGIDSHGFRLLPHYRAAISGGRLNGAPELVFTRTRPGAGILDAGHAHGARAMYRAADEAAGLARDAGVGAAARNVGSVHGDLMTHHVSNRSWIAGIILVQRSPSLKVAVLSVEPSVARKHGELTAPLFIAYLELLQVPTGSVSRVIMTDDDVRDVSDVWTFHHELISSAAHEIVPPLHQAQRSGVPFCAVDHHRHVRVGARALQIRRVRRDQIHARPSSIALRD